MKRILFLVVFIYSLTFCITAGAQNRNLTATISASSANCSTAGSCVVLKKSADDGGVVLEITGSFTGTLNFEGSVGYVSQGASATWLPLSGEPDAQGAGALSSSTTSTGRWVFFTTGLTGVRVRASSLAAGSATITMQSALRAPVDTFVPGATSDFVTEPRRFVVVGGETNAGWGPLLLDDLGELLVNLSTASGQIGVYSYPVAPSAANQSITKYVTSAASTNSTSVDATTGNVYNISISNTNTTTYFLRMYNSASAPTCSSATNFVSSIAIPGAADAGQLGGREMVFPLGWSFNNGIAFCITGGRGSTDNTNAATGIDLTFIYK